MKKEDVIVVRKQIMDQFGLTQNKYTPVTNELYSKFISALARREYKQRPEVETQKEYLQIIPYVTLFTGIGKVLAYRRSGSEGRLHDYYSIGFGGHITKTDHGCINCATSRELEEEVGITMYRQRLVPVGFIYDDSVEVSAVHFGVHYVYYLLDSELQTLRPSEEIKQFENVSLDELQKLNIENWSRICLENARYWWHTFDETYTRLSKAADAVKRALELL